MLAGYIIDQATLREKRARKNDSGILRVLDRNDIHSSLVLKMHNGYYPGALRVIMCRRYRGAARC